MKYDEFIAQVQRRADLKTKNEAVQAIRAVLETLGERLAGGEPKDLAAQLPSEIASYLERYRTSALSFRPNSASSSRWKMKGNCQVRV